MSIFLKNNLLGSFIGKPFKEHGVGPDHYDCWGLAVAVYAAHGKRLPIFQQEAFDQLNISSIISNEELSLRWVKLDNPEYLSIIPIKQLFPNIGYITCHLGVYLEDGLFIHVLRNRKVEIDRVSSPFWKNKITGYYRYAE